MKYQTRNSKALAAVHPALFAAVQRWRVAPEASKLHTRRVGGLAKVLVALPAPLTAVTRAGLVAACAASGIDGRYREALLAVAKAMLEWAETNDLLPCELRLEKENPHTYKTISLPTHLKEEAAALIENHRVRRRGDKISKSYAADCLSEMESFYSSMKAVTPARELTSVSEITREDLLGYQTLLQSRGNAINGKPLAAKTVFSKVNYLVALISMGVKAKRAGFSKDVIDKLDLDGFDKDAQADRYLSRGAVAKIYALDRNSIAGLDTTARFVAIRDAALIIVQYDLAGRADEMARLSVDDVEWDNVTPGGLVPVVIRDGKCRTKGSKEEVYLTPAAVEYLELYLEARKALCAERDLHPRPAEDKKHGGVLGVPLFISESGRPLTTDFVMENFKRLAARRGIKLKHGQGTHVLRHSKVTHWVEDGVDIQLVSKWARHRSIEITFKKYYHHRKELDIARLESLYGKRQKGLSGAVLPDVVVLEGVVRFAIEAACGAKALTADVRRIVDGLKATANPSAFLGDLYTVPEACKVLKLSRTQVYEKIRVGTLPWVKMDNGQKAFSKAEIDTIASLRSSEDAQLALGLRARSRLHTMVQQGLIEAVKHGAEVRFTDRSIVDCALHRNGVKIESGRRYKAPAGFSVELGVEPFSARTLNLQSGPGLTSNTTMNHHGKP